MADVRSAATMLLLGGNTDVTPCKIAAHNARGIRSSSLLTSRPTARLRTQLPSFSEAEHEGIFSYTYKWYSSAYERPRRPRGVVEGWYSFTLSLTSALDGVGSHAQAALLL